MTFEGKSKFLELNRGKWTKNNYTAWILQNVSHWNLKIWHLRVFQDFTWNDFCSKQFDLMYSILPKIFTLRQKISAVGELLLHFSFCFVLSKSRWWLNNFWIVFWTFRFQDFFQLWMLLCSDEMVLDEQLFHHIIMKG